MLTSFRYVPVWALVFASLGLAEPAQAQFWRQRDRGRVVQTRDAAAYDKGYRDGFKNGEKDAREGRTFAYARDKKYRQVSGNRDVNAYRAGYETGYRDAYLRRSSGRAVPRTYPDPRTYPSGSNRYPGQYGYDVAFQNGVNDGYDKGIEDARDNDRFDPTRHGWYRSGERGYERQYGSREQYKNLYRGGFREGYERGYREGRQYGR